MIRYLLTVLLLVMLLVNSVEAASCNAPIESSAALGHHESEATPLQFAFDSGASWNLCWHIDQHAGLVLSRVFYAAPRSRPVQVLDAASIGQILFKYDEDTHASHLLSEPGLGRGQSLTPASSDCEAGEQKSGIDNQTICLINRDVNHMTKARHAEPTRRHEIILSAQSGIGSHNFEQVWRLSEDGQISPSVVYSGRINRYTNDPRYGIKLNGSDQYAASATLLINWRLDFNINGTGTNDRIDEIEFIPSVTEPGKRAMTITPIVTEASHVTNNQTFRGWRVSDAEYSSGEDSGPTATTRVGYYLDPQSAGYRYISRTEQWSQFDLSVTVRHDCEKLASGNDRVNPECGGNLDQFINNESVSNTDSVLWFSLARHVAPRSEDYPAITAVEVGFTLIPFDWSIYSPFNPPLDELASEPIERTAP